MRLKRHIRRSTLRLFFALSALALGASAQAASAGVLPPDSHAFGKTYGAWSAAWWRYVLAQPLASNPLTDTTGARCGTAQSGPVFFLVGGPGEASVTRDQCTVPVGKALFFPLINVANDALEPGAAPLHLWE